MHSSRFMAIAVLSAIGICAEAADDYIHSDAFERRACDGVGCTYCSPAVCGSHSHCTPQPDASSLCTYPDGAGTQGATCAAAAACVGPDACVDTGAGSHCQHWCSRPAGSECQAVPGTSCVGFAVPLLIGGQEWGVCL